MRVVKIKGEDFISLTSLDMILLATQFRMEEMNRFRESQVVAHIRESFSKLSTELEGEAPPPPAQALGYSTEKET